MTDLHFPSVYKPYSPYFRIQSFFECLCVCACTLICTRMRAAEVNVTVFLLLPVQASFRTHFYSPGGIQVTDGIQRKDCKIQKWGLLIHTFIGNRMSLFFFLWDYFISSEQNCDIWYKISGLESQFKRMFICASCPGLNIWAFLKHFSLTKSVIKL